MKNRHLLFAICVFLGITNTFAQEKKETIVGGFEYGDKYVSGGVNYTSSKSSLSSETLDSYQFSPAFGYFVTDHIAIQTTLSIGAAEKEDYYYSDGNYYSNYTDKTETLGVQLESIYFFTPSKQFSFLLSSGFGYYQEKSKYSEAKAFVIFVYPGINYFLTENFNVKASVGSLQYGSTTIDDSDPSTVFNLNINLSSLNFSLGYTF